MQNRAIIIGSGNSISEGIEKGLWSILKNEVTFSINDNIQFFNPTVAMFGDWTCYKSRREFFSKHPLTIGRYSCQFNHPEFDCHSHEGLILLKSSNMYTGSEVFTKGFYSPILTGCFALSVAIALQFQEIFLLGFDECEINGKTHFYQDIMGAGIFQNCEGTDTSGVGKYENGLYKTSIYNKSDKEINLLWEPFKEVKNIQIYNISSKSRITVFDKMKMDDFLDYLEEHPTFIQQDIIQGVIREVLQPFNRI